MIDQPHTETATAGVAGEARPLDVVVADDHPLFRAGIVRALEDDDRFAVVGEAANGSEAADLIHRRRPHLALLDLRMPKADGLLLLARLRHSAPEVAVVVLSAYTDRSLVHSAMAAGAAGYAAKDTDRDEIAELLVDAAAGRRRVLVRDHVAPASEPRPRLSARERSVLSMLNRGWDPQEVALLGSMSLTAVQAHAANARRKLGAATTADAIAAAEAWGLLS